MIKMHVMYWLLKNIKMYFKVKLNFLLYFSVLENSVL